MLCDTADAEHYAQREEKEISLFHGDFPFCRSIRLSLLSTIVLHGMRQNKNTPICSFFIGMLLSACSIAHKFRKVNMLFYTIFMYICCILCLKSPQNQKITDDPSRASVIFPVFPIIIRFPARRSPRRLLLPRLRFPRCPRRSGWR